MRTLCYFLENQMRKNTRSNAYNLKTYLAISAFNFESIHKIKIEINGKVFFEKELTKNKEYQLKILDYFDYEKPGNNNIQITWTGEHECENKFMKIYKIVVNDQHIAPHSAIITPIQNEYIKHLLSTDEGIRFYKKKIFHSGHQQGWYGTYKFKFLLDVHRIQNDIQESFIAATGIKSTAIYTDVERANLYKKANRNDD